MFNKLKDMLSKTKEELRKEAVEYDVYVDKMYEAEQEQLRYKQDFKDYIEYEVDRRIQRSMNTINDYNNNIKPFIK